MPEVTGTIGNDHVELNNAATEATLKLILAGIKGSSKEAAAAIDKLAKNAGLDPDTIKKVNDELKDNSTALYKLGQLYGSVSIPLLALEDQFKKYSPLVKTLTDGSGNVSSAFNQLGAMVPGAIGVLLKGVGALAGVQQDYLKSYQTLTNAGVNFGGSLTNMRMAASNSYLTLDQFNNIVKNNGKTFAMLGGSVNAGAEAFFKMSKTLITSPAGTALLNLGYTTEQVNEGMASYIAISGARNVKDKQVQQGLIDGSAQYMQTLDGLSRLTGESRDQLEKQMKQESENAAWQLQLAGMSEKEKEKATAGLAAALSIGGKGAADAFKARVMNMPVITPEGQAFVSTMGKTAGKIDEMGDAVSNSSKGITDVQNLTTKAMMASRDDISKYDKRTIAAMINSGGPLASTFQKMGLTAAKLSNLTEEQVHDILVKKEAESKEVEQAVEAQKAMQKLGQEILASLLPVFKLLSPIIPPLATAFLTLAGVLTTFKIALMAVEAFERMKLARASGSGALGTARALLGGGGGAGGGSNVAGGLASKATGTAGNVANSGGGGVSKILGGLAEGLKKLGDPKAMLGAVTLAMLGGTVLIAAKGFKEFADVEWESVGKGVVGMTGLAAVAMLLSSASAPMIIGSVAVGLLGGALWLAGKGFQQFQELDWETIAKGAVGIGVLGLEAAGLGLLSPAIVAGGGALVLAGAGIAAVGLAMKLLPNNTADSLANLGQGLKALWDNTPVTKLFLMAPAIGALGLAMIPLTASTALYKASGGLSQLTADLTNITKTVDSGKIDGLSSSIKGLASSMSSLSGGGISGILSGLGEKFAKLMGAEGPLEKLEKLAKLGPGLMASGQGMQLLNQNLSNMLNLKVNNIDQMTESLSRIKVKAGGINQNDNFSSKLQKIELPTTTEKAKKLGLPEPLTKENNVEPVNSIDLLSRIAEEMRILNLKTQDVIRHARDTADYTKQTVDATKKLKGDLFA